LCEQALHLRQLVRGRRASCVTKHARAQRSLPNKGHVIRREARAFDARQVLVHRLPIEREVLVGRDVAQHRFARGAGQRRGGATAVAGHFGRDALLDRAFHQRIQEHGFVAVRVNVNETRRNVPIRRVERARGSRVRQIAYRGDGVANDTNVRALRWRAGAVVKCSVADDEIKVRMYLHRESLKLKVESWKLEAGSWKLEVES